MNHIAEPDLRALYEQGADAPDSRRLILHLKTCPECSSRLQAMRAMDRLLRRAVKDHAPAALTAKIMNELGIQEAPSFAWRILQYAAPVLGLLVVTGVVLGVFYLNGAFDQPDVQSQLEYGRSMYESVGSITGTVNGWMNQYFSFAVGGRGTLLPLFLVIFFVAIGLLDRFLFSPILRRRME